jgi:hypothetical protein
MFVCATAHTLYGKKTKDLLREKELHGQSRVSETVEINIRKKEQEFKLFKSSKHIVKSSWDSLHLT